MRCGGFDRMKKSRSTTTGTDRIRRGLAFLLALTGALLLFAPGVADDGEPADGDGDATPRAIMLTVDGAIGPATTDYLTRGIETAEERGVDLLIIRMDTPGGLTEATRDIVKAIRGSEVPVATWVAPGGARAASAGTYIRQSCRRHGAIDQCGRGDTGVDRRRAAAHRRTGPAPGRRGRRGRRRG